MQEKIGEWLNDQEWFQQIKQKWDELDAQSRLYLQIAGICGSVGLVLFSLFSFMWKVHKLKAETADKTQLLTMITSADNELKRLRELNAPLNQAAATPEQKPQTWPEYIDSSASRVGIDKNVYTVSEPKPGTSSELTKESLIDVSLKKVNIKQVVRFALSVQNGGRPVKLRNLVIDTHPDGTGYLNATLSLSAFNLISTNK